MGSIRRGVRFYTPGEAGIVLSLSRSRVRYLADAGRLPGVIRTPSGRRLIPAAAVEALAAERRKRVEQQPR